MVIGHIKTVNKLEARAGNMRLFATDYIPLRKEDGTCGTAVVL
jgi:hypothetical protein